MRTSSEDQAQLAEQLRTFLSDSGWSPGRHVRGLQFYLPPASLGIQGKYSIALPEDAQREGMASLLYSAANSLVEIYGYADLGGLLNRAASVSQLSRPARLVTRLIDASTENGTIRLTSLTSYVNSIEQGLYRGAKFKLGDDGKISTLVAHQFVNDCKFLQTEQGSFVATVEVPNTILRQGDLFGVEPLDSTEVCSSVFNAIQFLNERILGDSESFESTTVLSEAIALFNVELLESLTNVVTDSDMETIEFSLDVGTRLRTSSTGRLTSERKARLRSFLEFVRDQLRAEKDLEVTGSIVELRSRDPEGSRNYIKVVSTFHGDKTFVTATLTNEQYQVAVDAHLTKREVSLKGQGVRLKTQIRLNKVDEFSA
jgi:hypothetical protein